MSKKKREAGIIIPQPIVYALVLSVITGAFASYDQLQSVDRRLQTIEAEINVLTK